MTSRIHIAAFGNRGGAHTVLAHTGVQTELLGEIVWHTDAPPHGDTIQPFVSGYRIHDSYIVQRTRADSAAERPGMVATRAAIVPLALLALVDLGPLFRDLAEKEAETQLLPMDVETLRQGVPHLHPPGAPALASELLAHGRAIWTGPGLEAAVACVWLHLASQDRSRLVFGTAFHPQALSVPSDEQSITVVNVPERARPRWTGWASARADSATQMDSARDALFAEDDGRSAALANELGLQSVPFSMWRLLAAAADLLADLANLDHESTRALLQLFGLIQPDEGKGRAPKQAALAHLAAISAAADFSDVRGLRGIPWQALPTPPDLPTLLNEWARDALATPLRPKDFVEAIVSLGSDSEDPFELALAASLHSAANQLDMVEAAKALLNSQHGDRTLEWIVEHLDSSDALDLALAGSIRGRPSVPQWIASATVIHNLPITHAVAIDPGRPIQAWEAQVGFSARSDTAEGILAERVGALGTVQAALTLTDEPLIDRAGRIVAEHPGVLPQGDPRNERYRAVWAAAVRYGADPWHYVSHADAVEPILALVANGRPIDAGLLDALSHTPAADLSTNRNRAALWRQLPPESRARFLAATAPAVARAIRAGDPLPEPELQAAILSAERLEAVSREDPGQAVYLLRVLPGSREADAELVMRHGRFATHEAAALAELIVDRRWRHAAEALTELARKRPDLLSAAREVESLFGPIERLGRFVGYGTGHRRKVADTADLRDALLDAATRLYAAGPAQDALWERAGGNNADLNRGSTGRAQWGMAIQAVIAGHRGAPKLRRLVATMMEDYPNNPDLTLIAWFVRK